MKAQNICLEACVRAAQNYQTQRKTLTETETQLLDFILEVELEEPTLEDALGLINLEDLTPHPKPQVKGDYQFVTKAARNCLESLDELIEAHKHTPISVDRFGVVEEELLANVSWLPSPIEQKSREENLEMLPLAEVWQDWYTERGEKLRDADGLELVRAKASYYVNLNRYSSSGFVSILEDSQTPDWLIKACKYLFVETSGLRYPQLIPSILEWLVYLFPPANIVDFILNGAIKTLSFIPKNLPVNNSEVFNRGWEIAASLLGWVQLLVNYRQLSLAAWSDEQHYRYWLLMSNLENYPFLVYFSYNTSLEDLVILYRAGKVSQVDIMAHILATQAQPQASNPFEALVLTGQTDSQRRDFRDLGFLTSRKLPPNLDPILKEIGDRARQRVLEVELKRGDLPTAATYPALALRSVVGIGILTKLLQALGKEKLIRGYSYNNNSKAAVFSQLLRVSFPGITETPQDFAAQVKAVKIPEQQLIELAFYAPQWTNYVQYALGWDNFSEGVWWIHAHTKDNNWYVDAEVREEWKVQVSEQTPLSDQNLIDGAVDVEWFLRIYKDLQGERWQQLYAAAKYASSGAGHKRAQLFAEAMLGEISRDTLVNRIQEKRNQDAVRALGLLPIHGERDVLERYQILQEFLRTSRQFGSQKQASEKLAVTIGMENLARTANYRDPQRLEWAMEAEAIADLTEKPQEVILEDVTVSLAITQGKPEISISKQGKPLKAIPAKYKKDPAIVELQNRKQEISRQEKRMRLSLEQAMLRGDSFSREEFQQLCRHPILAPMLEGLIFVGQEELGYPCHQGTALRQHDGTTIPLKSSSLTIAHSYDLLQTQAWHLWQADCFQAQRRQPFKQVFRELYLLTPSEVMQNNYSRRYEGHQINPKQALALWGQRGWVTCPEEGIRKTFHEANLSVWVSFLQGFYTPLEMEGLTLEGVYFTKRGDWQAINLSEVPPKIFSEVMRDVDLIVSVAHLGGVDPEASASTVEMRSALVKESCRLLKLENVNLQGNHALITGELGSYSLHLGSGMVHRQLGGALCIIPVHSQHRGRIFLPFADDDPKTAEVVSKVILLAKDKEIKDPTILQQIV
jgi:hypothetical protein